MSLESITMGNQREKWILICETSFYLALFYLLKIPRSSHEIIWKKKKQIEIVIKIATIHSAKRKHENHHTSRFKIGAFKIKVERIYRIELDSVWLGGRSCSGVKEFLVFSRGNWLDSGVFHEYQGRSIYTNNLRVNKKLGVFHKLCHNFPVMTI